jgi:hypothetical protein
VAEKTVVKGVGSSEERVDRRQGKEGQRRELKKGGKSGEDGGQQRELSETL